MGKQTSIKAEKKSSVVRAYKIYILLIVFIAVTSFTTYFLYIKTQSLFRWSLDERMVSVASVASSKFHPGALDKIKGSESAETEDYRQIVLELQRIREKTRKLKYVYILRKTNDPMMLEFVADADSLHPDILEDINSDGLIDESDKKTYPGDPYDISEFPDFQRNAFVQPFVDPELSNDPWGTFLSGTAPIEGDNPGEPIKYVIGLDLDVSEFQNQTNLALIPFALFIVFLLLVLTTQTTILKRMWQSHVRLLADLDRQKDELLSIVSHQLATPVTSIKWYLEMMLDGDLGKLSKEQEESVKGMTHITADLSDLVSMILDVSRIQLGRMKIEKQKLSLQDFFKEILEVIEPKAKQKGINLVKNMPESLPDAMLDKRYTRMTVENLLSNAVKYTHDAGKVTLDIKIKNNTLYCNVSDTGVGIPKADQDKIFGKLFRASNVRNAVDGNGFGLYVAKGAVEAQGGKIWFESTEGKGTTFFIELPLA